MRPEADPDLKESDKDLSLNYKGSLGGRILDRFLEAAKDNGKVKVVRKETGETTYIKPETLKQRSDEYSLPEEGDSGPAWAPEDHESYAQGKKLWDASKADPELASVFKDLLNPTSQGGGYVAKSTPNLPAEIMMRGRPLPEGVKTLGQLVKVLNQGKKNPPKTQEAPKDPESPKAPEAEKVPDEAPKGEDPGTPPEPDEGNEEPKEDEKEPEKAPEEAPKEKGKTPEPKRRQAEEWEQMAAKSAILENLPRGAMREGLLDANLHPDDVADILATYHAARSGDMGAKAAEKLVGKAQHWFQPDPTKVPLPKTGKDQAGNEIPFTELSPEEQAEAGAQHRNRTVALSLAAHDQVTRSLTRTLGAPPALADFLSAFLLQQKPPKEGEQVDPEKDNAQSKELAAKVFQKVLTEGKDEKIAPGTIKNVLEFTKSNPAAERLAVSYFQARDYQTARARFLDPSSPEHISEHQGPTDIARGVVDGSRFLMDRSRLYPPTAITQDPAGAFRTRILKHVQTLNPEKYPFVRNHVDKYERQLFDSETARHEKLVTRTMDRYEKVVQKVIDKHDKIIEKLRSKHEGTIDEYKEQAKAFDKEYRKYVKEKVKYQKLVQEAMPSVGDYRESPTEGMEPPKPPVAPKPPPDLDLPEAPELPPEPELPEPPAKPVRYGLGGEDQEEERERLWDEQNRQVTASFSSYSGCKSMGPQNRQAVYWGVAPYPKGHEGFAPYTKWNQVHDRDLGEKDYTKVLKSAREWLKAPVLSKSVEGIERDTQLRAALDLAIQTLEDGRYSAGFDHKTYNSLLARLAGKSEDETLLTVHEAAAHGSVYVATGEEPMSASAVIRKQAAEMAYTNPSAAYDFIVLADKVAQEEQQEKAQQSQEQQKQGGQVPPQFLEHMKGKGDDKKDEKKDDKDQGQEQQKQAASYRALKASIIDFATKNPAMRPHIRPILQTIKNLG
jgi:hypothetical protein